MFCISSHAYPTGCPLAPENSQNCYNHRLPSYTKRVTYQLFDGLYLQGRAYDICVSNVIDTSQFLWVYNPSRQICINLSRPNVLLGFIIDPVSVTITLTPEKALKVKEACAILLGQGHLTM